MSCGEDIEMLSCAYMNKHSTHFDLFEEIVYKHYASAVALKARPYYGYNNLRLLKAAIYRVTDAIVANKSRLTIVHAMMRAIYLSKRRYGGTDIIPSDCIK